MLAWLTVLPPVIVIGFVAVSHRLITSLVLGIAAAALILPLKSTTYSVPLAISSFGDFLYDAVTDPWNIRILIFVPMVLAMIKVMLEVGGFHALIARFSWLCRNARSTRLATFGAGIALFFDDYANTMIVGSAMRPLADRFGVSRAKLAFLVDATSAPIAGVAIISTWIGYEIGLFNDVAQSLNLGLGGFEIFVQAVSMRFYCLFMIVFVFVNAWTGRDFGPMLKAERAAFSGHEVLKDPLATTEFNRGAIWVVILPIGVLLALVVGGMWHDGGGSELGFRALFSLGQWRAVLMKSENSVSIMLNSVIIGLVLAIIMAGIISRHDWPKVLRAVYQGAKSSAEPVTILILAWGLKEGLDALGTGNYLVALLKDAVAAKYFPALLFVVAAITAFGTGTSWGTMAILIPTAVPVAFALDNGELGLLTIISFGAVLDGAIFGDHCSPISDTTIMSSAATGCNHVEHVKTQLPYALLVAFCALIFGYLLMPLGVSNSVALILGAGATAALFGLLAKKIKTS